MIDFAFLVCKIMENSSIGAANIFDVFEQLKNHELSDEDAAIVEEMSAILGDKRLKPLIEIHELFQKKPKPLPLTINVMDLLKEVQFLLKRYPNNDILSALSAVLDPSSHLAALLSCHDRIANGTFDEPQIADILDNSVLENDDAEETIKVVRLVKNDEPLGATIATDELTGEIVIARILKGGAADRSGLIHVNDILVEVNDVLARGKKPLDLIRMLAGFKGALTLKLIPGESPEETIEDNLFVRSRFTYLPQADNLIPCIEAGLTFYPGDVLRIVSKDDLSWWQATKVESSDKSKMNGGKVGLIPSLKLQTKREKLRRQAQSKAASASIKGSNVSLMSSGRRNTWNRIRSSFRKKRSTELMPNHKSTSPRQLPYYPPYELVAKYDPAQVKREEGEVKTYRPIVLVGPQGVGRNELKDRLIDSNPSHYGVPVPHTSRPQQPGEVDQKDYHFVSRDFMEIGIRQGRFLEYGEYRGNYYGTSLDAVHAVIKSGLVCVLTPYPQALKLLRTKEFMSYIIFVKPPSVVEMGRLDHFDGNLDVKAKLTIERSEGVPFSDDEMRNLVNRGEMMIAMYGRLFDASIVNDNMEHAFSQLREISFYLENDQQWVPADWVS